MDTEKKDFTLGERTENYYTRTGIPNRHRTIAINKLKDILDAIGEIYFISFYGDYSPEETIEQLSEYISNDISTKQSHLDFLGEEVYLKGKKLNFFRELEIPLSIKGKDEILKALRDRKANEKFSDSFSFSVDEEENYVVVVEWRSRKSLSDIIGNYGIDTYPNFEETIVNVIWALVMSDSY